jgi:ornithine cyclodeaminase/alanine dehydrogenase-like protein (mu-crystallin family)
LLSQAIAGFIDVGGARTNHDAMTDILIIGRDLVRQLLPMGGCIGLMEQAFKSVSDGTSVQGLRAIVAVPNVPGGLLGVMPGGTTVPARFGVKVISVRHGGNTQSHQGGVLLFDSASFAPIALLHAGEITAIRTAAATAAASKLLARPNARILALLGTGEQANTHLEAFRLLQAWDEIRIWGRDTLKAERFAARHAGTVRAAASVAAAVAGADVVCTLTASSTPIFTADMLRPGMHLNLVGASVAAAREVDSESVARGSFFVDHEAMTRSAGGEFITALREGLIAETHIRAEVGNVLLGRATGRQSGAEITIFKSLGMPVEDLIAADFIVNQANRLGLGVRAGF